MKRPDFKGNSKKYAYELEQYSDHLEKQNAELLEALKKSVRLLKLEGWTHKDGHISKAESLIQKTEGGNDE